MKEDQPPLSAYDHASWLLMAEPEALRAIAEVESGREGAFLPDDRPVILFERHVFHRLTGGRFFPKYSNISQPNPGGYGKQGANQHDRLSLASSLDRESALKSCSWGLYQIMGENYEKAGYSSVQRFVNAMYRSVEDHLRALVMFLRRDSRLVDAIRDKDWVSFAKFYNGPRYYINEYDKKMSDSYEKIRNA